MKYRVYGRTTVTVTVEVSADNKKDALEVAFDQLTNLTAFAGNGGGAGAHFGAGEHQR